MSDERPAPSETQLQIQSAAELANSLRRMVFSEVSRVEVLSSSLDEIEDEILDELRHDLDMPIGIRMKIYETLSNRRKDGQNFVLHFIKLLDQRGGFADEVMDDEGIADAEMIGDLDLDEEQKKDLGDKLRAIAKSKLIQKKSPTKIIDVAPEEEENEG